MGNMEKGIAFENEMKHELERMGFVVFRQSKSTIPDLIAFREGRRGAYFFECKMGLHPYLSREEKEFLNRLEEKLDVTCHHVWQKKKKNGRYGEVMLTHVKSGTTISFSTFEKNMNGA